MKHRFLFIMALLLTAASAWADDDPIDLTPSADGTVWTLPNGMPEYDVELEVEYYTDAELAINDLPEAASVTVANKDAIEAARAAYDALTADQKAAFPADVLAKLTAAEAALAIAELPAANEVTTANKTAIEAARTAYDALTEAQKTAVGADALAKLEAAEAALAVAETQAAINALPEANAVAVSDKDAIEAARAAYDALTADQKAAFPADVLAKLTAAEAALAIAELPAANEVTTANKTAIEAARTAYDALTEAQKTAVGADALAKLTTAEAALAIVSLPAEADVTTTDKAAIEAARAAYDALTEAQKTAFPADVLAKLTAAEAVLTAVDNLQTAINALPTADNVTVANKEAIETARADYNALSASMQAAFPADVLAKLEAAEAALAIAELPAANEVTTANKTAIEAARTAYDALTEAQKTAVGADALAKLEAAEAALAVAETQAAINALPEAANVAVANKEAIEAARAAYDALTADQKAAFPADVLAKLTAAEAALAIAELPAANEVTTANKTAIEAARTAYDALTDDQKTAFPTDVLAKLTAAEAALVAVETQAAINALPEPSSVKYSDKAAIEAARAAYDALTEAQKTLVGNEALTKLQNVEAAFAATIIEIQTEWIQNIPSVTYTGSALEPTVTVKNGEYTLVAGEDYDVTYSNNINAGTATATIIGKGQYKGTVLKEFTINAATITASATGGSYTYDGYSHSITVRVSRPSSGYAIEYSTDNSTWSSTKPSRYQVGSTTVYYKVTAPNYNDKTGSATVTITRATGSIAFDPTEVTKTWGDPNFTKTYSSKKGSGSITYSSDDENVATVTNSGVVTIKAAGTAHIKVNMAQSSGYTSASATYTLTVNPADLSEAVIALDQTSFDYDGTEKKPNVKFAILNETTVLKADKDYTVSYADNVNAGTEALAIISGIGNYTGTASQTFTINSVTTTDGNITVVDGGSETVLTINDMGTQQGKTLTPGMQVTTLNYYRSLNASDESVYTVCLPYAPKTDASLKYYTLTGCEGTTLKFDEITGAPQAYTPYLVSASKTTDIGTENLNQPITMSQTVDNSFSAGNYVMKGSLAGFTHDQSVGKYILQSGNRWGLVGSDTHAYIPPFRAYIEATVSGARMLDSSFYDEATGIYSLRTVDRDGTERYYDLNGRRIDDPKKTGIYIRNGRKEVLK